VWKVGFFSDFCFGGIRPSGVGKRSNDAPTLQTIAAEVVAAALGSATSSDNVSLQYCLDSGMECLPAFYLFTRVVRL
jgi:hypothetical protein